MNFCPITNLICPFKKIVHVTELSNGSATCQMHYCYLCGPKVMEDAIPKKKKDRCPSCKSTLQDLATTSRIGCSQCYQHFKKDLTEEIKKHQAGAKKHVGKSPLIKMELNLEDQLNQAIQSENYEKAAKIKKIIDNPPEIS
jgi:protein-arginine kinase activator protein McsA